MRVLMADDHWLFRDGLRRVLEAYGVEVVGEARDGREAVAMAGRLRPDVALLDLHMPAVSGVEATRQIMAAYPDVKVVILTGSEDDTALLEVMRSGAHGFLLKNQSADEVVRYLEAVANGEPVLAPQLAGRLLRELARPPASAAANEPNRLTAREREVVDLLVQGVTSDRELAERLIVSEHTIKHHLRNVQQKLGVHNRAQIIAHAVRVGWVSAPATGRTRG